MHEDIGAEDVRLMVAGAIRALGLYKEEINALNVFPVPDGDTGTNMLLTMHAVRDEMQGVGESTMEFLADAMSMGSLMGARGNSGVVLSQIIKGATDAHPRQERVNITQLAEALERGSKTAYKAVMKPVEGTILTVCREAADAGMRAAGTAGSVEDWLREVIMEAARSLEKTPDLLPVLKEAGVVDAGGRGLLAIFEGMLMALTGEEISEAPVVLLSPMAEVASDNMQYEAQFMLSARDSKVEKYKECLNELGESVLVVGGNRLYRVHIHTNDLGKVIAESSSIGTLTHVEITDLFAQVQEAEARGDGRPAGPTVEEKPIGVVAVATGEGVKRVLLELNVDRVVDGGQSMNPSTAEILQAIDSMPQDKVVVFPNNKNIIPSAEQARALSEKEITVIPTRSIAECFSGMIAFEPALDLDTNRSRMQRAVSGVKTGTVTVAVRDSKFKLGKIRKGDFIGLFGGGIAVAGPDLEEVTFKLLQKMVEEGGELITLIKGAEVPEDLGARVEERVRAGFPVDLEVIDGGQPVYHYIIGVE